MPKDKGVKKTPHQEAETEAMRNEPAFKRVVADVNKEKNIKKPPRNKKGKLEI